MSFSSWYGGSVASGGGGSASIVASEAAPSSPTEGMLWWRSNNSGGGQMFLRYDGQWIEVGVEGSGVDSNAGAVAALSGATLIDVGTPAAGDAVLLRDASDSNQVKTAQFSLFGGVGLGAFARSQRWNTHSLPRFAGGGAADLGEGNLICVPMFVQLGGTIDRMGFKVDSAGSGSVVRVGIYNDTGAMYPGSLLLDGGTVAMGGSFAVYTVTVNQVLASRSLYWLAIVVQGGGATRPSIQRNDHSSGGAVYTPAGHESANSILGNSNTQNAFFEAGVTGALPSTFTTTPAYVSNVPTVGVRWL